MNSLYLSIVEHYEKCLDTHGDSFLGVDWPNYHDTLLRYRVMLDLIKIPTTNVSLLDFGCGTSMLYEFILNHKLFHINYSGLDISQKFYELSLKKYPDNKYYCFDAIIFPDQLIEHDYIIMNGVFTEKLTLTFNEMRDYMFSLLKIAYSKTRIGLAFNVMSKNVDWERDDLFYMPLDCLSSFITSSLSRNFLIRNDYGLYEYTVYIYKDPIKCQM